MFRPLAGLITLVVIFCAGCATSPQNETLQQEASRPQPDWVTGESNDYPRLDYITARTKADTADEAARLAKARLSQMFLIDIRTFDMSLLQADKTAGYTLNTTFLSNQNETVAAPEVKRVLDSIKVADQWHDKNNNTYHALATLPRNTGIGYLRKQIQQLDQKTQDYLKQARNNKDALARMAMTAKAWRAQQLRAALQEAMRHADLTGRGIEPKWTLEKIETDLNRQIPELHIYPTGLEEDMNAREMTDMLTGGLKTARLKPASEKKADYILRGTLDTAISGEKDGWAIGQGNLKLVLANKNGGNVRGTKQWQIEITGLDENAAIRRVKERAVFTLKREMRNTLIDMAM